jgi:hypothetical protein
MGIAPDTAAEAAQRILHTREQRTVPPLGVILRTCREVQADRPRDSDDAKMYTMAAARELAERRLKLMNERNWKAIPITDENIDLYVAQMEREGVVRIEGLRVVK